MLTVFFLLWSPGTPPDVGVSFRGANVDVISEEDVMDLAAFVTEYRHFEFDLLAARCVLHVYIHSPSPRCSFMC